MLSSNHAIKEKKWSRNSLFSFQGHVRLLQLKLNLFNFLLTGNNPGCNNIHLHHSPGVVGVAAVVAQVVEGAAMTTAVGAAGITHISLIILCLYKNLSIWGEQFNFTLQSPYSRSC